MEEYHHPWDDTKGDAIALLLFLILIIIVPVLCFINCTDSVVNPQRYKECVVIDKDETTTLNLRLKLTKHLSDSLHKDYMWITVPKYELDRYAIGDTIK